MSRDGKTARKIGIGSTWTRVKNFGSSLYSQDAWVRRLSFGRVPASLSPSQEAPWSTVAEVLRNCGYVVDLNDPGPGAVLGFDKAGKVIVLASGASTPRRYVAPILASLSNLEQEESGGHAGAGQAPARSTPNDAEPLRAGRRRAQDAVDAPFLASTASELLVLLKSFSDSRLIVIPRIERRQIDNCRKAFRIPHTEEVLGLIDFSILGNARSGIVFTSAAAYVLTGKRVGTRMRIPYESFGACSFKITSAFDEEYVHICSGKKFRVSGDTTLAELIVEVFEDIQSRSVRTG